MRSPALRALALGFLSLACATSFSVPATAAASPNATAGKAVTSARATCYSNIGDLATYRTMSQNFAPILDAYDSAAADDVTLKKRCRVKSVQVIGAYSAEDSVDSETVTFYKDTEGQPGKVISSQTKVGTDTDGGSFDIKIKPVTLKKGTYWISVVANLDSDSGGQWYWTTSNTQKGALALWENPPGGWQYGCLSWAVQRLCLGAGPGPDLSFSLSK